jgi:dTDP-L-rhamnose 4-epimerase
VRVLVTGAAGFIGGYVVELLLSQGHEVVALDSLEPQVHGRRGEDGLWPEWFPTEVERHWTNVRNRDGVLDALRSGASVVVHLAAQVGVGQAETSIDRYVSDNVGGTGAVLDAVLSSEVEHVVIAGSMSAYGEGLYRCGEHGEFRGRPRRESSLLGRCWEVLCPICGAASRPVGIPETEPLEPAGIYAETKRAQENLGRLFGRAGHGRSVAVARFFNAYGPRQALGNPYTGIAAIFTACALGKVPAKVFEDGQQLRDFIHVRDVASAVVTLVELAELRGSAAPESVWNVGTGCPTSVLELAETVARIHGSPRPEVLGLFRTGDIRSCYADASKLERIGWEPSVRLGAGLAELAEWSLATGSVPDPAKLTGAIEELLRRGLLR